MSSIQYTENGGSFFGKFIKFIVFMMVLAFILFCLIPKDNLAMQASLFDGVDTTASHSALRHADDQELYQKCLDEGDAAMAFINPATDHCAEIIKVTVDNEDKFLVRIVKQIDGLFREITAFSDDWAGLWEVEDYLVDGGYMQTFP